MIIFKRISRAVLALHFIMAMVPFARAQTARNSAALAPASMAQGPAVVRSTTPMGGIARGVVRAMHEATLTARISARIDEMPFAEGMAFKKGARLVLFDCERPLAEARAASAALDGQSKQVETNEELDRFNAIGKNELQISLSQRDKARAEAEALAIQARQCEILAPFAGRVAARPARQYESVQAGTPLLKVVDSGSTELDLIVPSQWLAWLVPGTGFQFRVDETGAQLAARVTRVLPSVDPVSRTIRIVATFTKPDARVLPGMSGTASEWQAAK
ncbi:efflux RND transporter periplasmic adaptor subunit [Massilia sp. S19_KUP03_FR1]|uniref:efflux RND transporter periplasmic adaptor subunit n=1 Tax=Massilia sp. S19_KUP03_FR1 TaxID=3025503 RepID=UPI002FCD6F13